MKYFVYYLIVVNIFTMILYGIDKVLAIHRKNRISERTLFLFGLIGGSLGGISGMLLFRHKTKKIMFYLWNILMISIWGYIIYKNIF